MAISTETHNSSMCTKLGDLGDLGVLNPKCDVFITPLPLRFRDLYGREGNKSLGARVEDDSK